jgi:hypothetical protein
MTIIWDVDDVLNALTYDWFHQEWLPSHPECRLDYAGLIQNPPHRLLGVDEITYLRSLDQYRLSLHARAARPVPEVLAWFRSHGAGCSHIALTARPLATIPPLAAWLFEHFGLWIRAFGFVPSARPDCAAPAYHAGKADWLKWISVGDILVDDNPQNLEQAAALGLKTILIPQPWNKGGGTLPETLNSLAQAAGLC